MQEALIVLLSRCESPRLFNKLLLDSGTLTDVQRLHPLYSSGRGGTLWLSKIRPVCLWRLLAAPTFEGTGHCSIAWTQVGIPRWTCEAKNEEHIQPLYLWRGTWPGMVLKGGPASALYACRYSTPPHPHILASSWSSRLAPGFAVFG